MRTLLPFMILLMLASAVFSQSPAEERRRRMAVRDVAARAEAGDPEAIYQLSILHERGYDSIPADSARSILLLREAADAGLPEALNLLGYKLINGEGVERDYSTGLAYIEKAAAAGDPKALSNIGYLLLYGEETDRDPEKAAGWLRKAADADILSAQSMLGDLYRDGIGVEKDTMQAETLYRLAFNHGLTDAGYKLAAITSAHRDSLPVPELLREGIYYFDRTAPSVGVGIFRKILEMPDSTAPAGIKAQAEALLGDAMSRGRGAEYNYEGSTRHYLNAALAGNPAAMFILGEMLEIFPDALNDFIRPEDPEAYTSAFYWLEKAREAGVYNASSAMRRLRDIPPAPENINTLTDPPSDGR